MKTHNPTKLKTLCNYDNILQKLPPPSAQTPILMILRVRTISSTFVWNAANWQTINFTDDFYLFFPLCRALETGFDLHFCLKLSESNCSSLSCLKTPNNGKKCFNPYSCFTHLMKRASSGQLTLKGGHYTKSTPHRLTHKNTKFQWSIWSLLGNIWNAFLVSTDSESMKIQHMFQCLGSCWYSFCGTGA